MSATLDGVREAQSRRLLQAGIALFLIGLLTGLAVPVFGNPRMGLASHVEALMNGTFLVVLGLLWSRLVLTRTQLSAAFWLAAYGTFANWLSTFLAAMWAAGSGMMPIAAGGRVGTAVQETVINGLLVSLGLAMIAVCVLVLLGLRTPRAAGAGDLR
jgi:hydroxylaminobenzene mutase